MVEDIAPRTYLMPKDQQKFVKSFDVRRFYMGKLNGAACGRHMIISNSLFELLSAEPDIIQEYDSDFLQIDGHKMDLRVDVLVT